MPSVLKQALKELCNTSPVLGAAIFSIEGLPFVSYFHAGTEEVAVAAIVASLHSASTQTVQELRQGTLKSIIVEGTTGKTIVIAIPPGYLLAVTAPDIARTGLVFSDAKKLAREVTKLLKILS